MNTLKIFTMFFKIAAVTLGGGYVILPVIQNTFVNKYKLISKEDLLEIISLVQGMPGSLAVNCSTLIGFRFRGLGGAIAGMLGSVLPSLMVISLISTFFVQFAERPLVMAFFKGIRPAVVALILYFGLNMMKSIAWNKAKMIFQAIFLMLFIVFDINPMVLIGLGMISGLVYTTWLVRKASP